MLKSKKTILGAILCALMALCLTLGAFGLTQKTEKAFADSIISEVSFTYADFDFSNPSTTKPSPTEEYSFWDIQIILSNGDTVVAFYSGAWGMWFDSSNEPLQEAVTTLDFDKASVRLNLSPSIDYSFSSDLTVKVNGQSLNKGNSDNILAGSEEGFCPDEINIGNIYICLMYEAPAPTISTISDVLNTVDFPTSTVLAWATPNDNFIYKNVNNSKLVIKVPFEQTTVDLNSPLSADNGNYKYTNGKNNITFTMKEGVLSSIIVTWSAAYYNGTYTKPISVSDILATNVNFPMEKGNWFNENGAYCYKTATQMYFVNGTNSSPFNLTTVVKDLGNGHYQCSLTYMYQIDFYLTDQSLSRFEVTNLGYGGPFVGTYQPGVILDLQGGVGGSYGVHPSFGEEMPTITPPTKNMYVFEGYFDAIDDGTKYYNADGTSAKKWDKTGVDLKLYAHWRPLTIGDIVPDDFPMTEETAWVNEHSLKAYVGGETLYVGNVNLAVNTYLTEDGSDYLYSCSMYDVKFVMTQGVLTSIVVSRVISSTANGTFKAVVTIEKPQEDTTIFIYNGDSQTYNVAESEYYTVSGNLQTDAGMYTVRIALKEANYKWKDGDSEDLTFDFVINQKAEDVKVQDELGEELTDSKVMIISAVDGIKPGAVFVVEVINLEKAEDTKQTETLLVNGNKIAENEKIYGIYDAKLMLDGTAIQPNGTITIKMFVPEKLREKEFRLYHIHNGTEVMKIDNYEDLGDGYITFDVDKLSQFAFIAEAPNGSHCLSVGAIVGIVLGSLVGLAIIVYVLGYFFLYRRGKLDDKKIRVIYKFLPRGND